MAYLNNFNPEKVDSVPEIRNQLRFLKKAIDNKEIGNDSDAYRKPATGIPSSDMSSDVQASLTKANTAYQKPSTGIPVEDIASNCVEIEWADLKDLRDNGQLKPGCWYRITDYECTTSQENTKSAGHQFDILVLATSASTLSEEARAIKHDNIYNISFQNGVTRKCYIYITSFEDTECTIVDCETLLGMEAVVLGSEIVINENNKTAVVPGYESTDLTEPDLQYNYFQNSNLNAWKIWYCLDNDTTRFAWADDGLYPAYVSHPYILDGEHLEFKGVKDFNGSLELFYGTSEQANRYYESSTCEGWVLRNSGYDESLFGTNRNDWTAQLENDDISVVIICDNSFDEPINVHSDELSENSIESKGVIYRMIDEHNNDCPYDFKNIMFKVPVSTDGDEIGFYDESGTDIYAYAFNIYDAGNDICIDGSIYYNANNCFCKENKIGTGYYDDPPYNIMLPRILFLSDLSVIDYDWIAYNTIGSGCNDIFIGQSCYSIDVSPYSTVIRVHSNCFSIIFCDECTNVEIGQDYRYIKLIGLENYYDDGSLTNASWVGMDSNGHTVVKNIFDSNT